MSKYYSVKTPSAIHCGDCILGTGTTKNNALEDAYGDIESGKRQIKTTNARLVEITKEEYEVLS